MEFDTNVTNADTQSKLRSCVFKLRKRLQLVGLSGFFFR